MSLANPSWHEAELLGALEPDVEKGVISIVADSDPLAARLFGVSPTADVRIDWRAVPGHVRLPPPPGRGRAGFELREPATDLRAFWEEIRRRNKISDDLIVYFVGDNLIDFALELPISSFNHHLVEILSIPQHGYLFPPNLAWCLNYTFEDEVYFGIRP